MVYVSKMWRERKMRGKKSDFREEDKRKVDIGNRKSVEKV